MPGVPDDPDEGADPEDGADPDPEPGTPDAEAAATDSTDSTTSSGGAMPGVPKTTGPTPSEAEQAGGSCGAPESADTETVHDLTTVFTFEALTRVADPVAVIADARSWSDWVGMVGEADVPRMNTFLRRNEINVDFFNGASRPEARLRRVSDTDSSFGSERQVVIGLEAQADLGDIEGWEFEHLDETADEAGWTLR